MPLIMKIVNLFLMFLPFFAAFFVLYNGQQNSDPKGRSWFWPYFVLGLKELVENLIVFKYDLRSFYFLYKPSELGMWIPTVSYTLDIVAITVFAIYFFVWLDIKKVIPVLIAIFGILIPVILSAISLSGVTAFNVNLFLRLIGIIIIVFVFIRVQMIYVEERGNFVVETRGYVSSSFLFMLPYLCFNFFNMNILGQMLRLFFYGLIVMPSLFMAFFYFRKNQEEKELLEKERDLIERLLNNIGSAIASNQDRLTILQMALEFATEATQARAGAIFLWNKKKTFLTVETVFGPYPPLNPVEDFIAAKEKLFVEKFKSESVVPGKYYVGKVAESKKPLLIRDATDHPDVVQSAKGVMDIVSIMCFPLMIEEEPLGVLSLLNKSSGAFNDSDFILGQAMAEQIAVALNTVNLREEYREKMEAEKQLAIAGQIQQDLLPTVFPDSEHFEIFATSKAAKGVSGDYYDLINFGDRMAIVMADVAGKGVPAALVMVMIRSAMRTITRSESEPKDVVAAINRAISGEVSQERYATLFMSMLDLHTGLLRFTNAGHGPMLVYRRLTDSFELLDTEGLPVGISPDTEYGQDDTIMNTGDIAVLYTDGITEAMNAKHEEYTMSRVKEDLRKFKDLSAKEISMKIIENITNFTGDEPQHDDETILVVKMK